MAHYAWCSQPPRGKVLAVSKSMNASTVFWHWLGPNAAGLVIWSAFCFVESLPFRTLNKDGPSSAVGITWHGWPTWLRVCRTWTRGGCQTQFSVNWGPAAILLACGYLMSMPAGRLASGPLVAGRPPIRRPVHRHPASVLLIVVVGTIGLGLAGQETTWRLWRLPVRPEVFSWRLIFMIVPAAVLTMAVLRWRAERPSPRGFEVLPIERRRP
jgi:hypothetical protein